MFSALFLILPLSLGSQATKSLIQAIQESPARYPLDISTFYINLFVKWFKSLVEFTVALCQEILEVNCWQSISTDSTV